MRDAGSCGRVWSGARGDGGGAEILPLDRAAWTATLGDLLNDAGRRRELAARGRQVAARYRWDRTCDQILQACGKVVGRTNSAGAR